MKRTTSFFAALILALSLMLNVSGSSRRTVQVRLNGEAVPFDTAAYIENNRTMVPLRAVAEALGLTVTWHHSGSTVDLIHGDWTPSLAGRTIVVDPGHGGSATGAVYEGVKESALNLAIAKKTAAAKKPAARKTARKAAGEAE